MLRGWLNSAGAQNDAYDDDDGDDDDDDDGDDDDDDDDDAGESKCEWRQIAKKQTH